MSLFSYPFLPSLFLSLFFSYSDAASAAREQMRIRGYDVLYQNTVLHLSCHELCVAHLVCLGLRYVLISFFCLYCTTKRGG